MNEPDVSRPLESSQADVTLITRGITVTAVVDVSTEQTLVVRPTGEGGEWKTKVRTGDPVEVFWIAGNEERTLPARITEVEGGDELRWALATSGPSERSQRRKAVRARVAVPVVVPWSDYQLAGATLDLSEGGMRARVDGWGVPPQSGTPVQVDLDLGNRMIHLQGEMVWHTAKGATWVLAVRFVDVPERDADLIRMHVFAALRAERARSAD
jgi:c-di-GMP-binding flagellar brake protein YcgR